MTTPTERHSTLDTRHSTLDTRHSTLKLQRPFAILRSACTMFDI